eukprot:14071365-Alexandrium_andersonii.AAC.1
MRSKGVQGAVTSDRARSYLVSVTPELVQEFFADSARAAWQITLDKLKVLYAPANFIAVEPVSSAG